MRKIIIGFTLAIVIGGAIGYTVAGYQYSAKLNKIKAAFPELPMMISVTGIVQSVSGNAITLQTGPSANPFEDLPTVRTVTITSSTKIVKVMPKDPKIYQAELDTYQKALQESTPAVGTSSPAVNLLIPPTPMNETTLKLSDLKAGDAITVDADKDVKTLVKFDAVKIILTGMTSAAAAQIPLPPTGVQNPVPAVPER